MSSNNESRAPPQLVTETRLKQIRGIIECRRTDKKQKCKYGHRNCSDAYNGACSDETEVVSCDA